MANKLLLFPDLNDRGIPLSRRQVDRLEADGKFPRRVHISPGRVGWLAAEIDDYVSAAISHRSQRIGSLAEESEPA